MCSPMIAMAFVAVAATAYSTYQSEKASAEQAKFAQGEADRNSKIAQNQAGILELSAQREEEYAREQARQIRANGRRITSTNRANLAKSGIDFSGSSYDIFDQNLTATEFDAMKAVDAGNVAAYNKRIQGTSAMNDSIGFDQRSDFYGTKTNINYLNIGVASAGAAASAYNYSGGFGGGASKSSSVAPLHGGDTTYNPKTGPGFNY